MADIIDEHGNPIQLTDESGRPVQLTDEHGVPMHLTGVATTVDSGQHAGKTIGDSEPHAGKTIGESGPHAGTTTIDSETKMHGGTHFAPITGEPVVGGGVDTTVSGGQPPCHPGVGDAEGGTQKLGRPGSSSSSSSEEEDGEGGRRRKKKGLMQKIKEKLPGYKNKEEVPEKVYTATTKVTVTTPAGPPDVVKSEEIRVEHHEEEHEKKGLIGKIKDKLPGHHAH